MKWIDRIRFGRLTKDLCEVCGQPLREKQCVEIVEPFDAEMTEFGLGGGGISATYCTSHDPRVETR